jgi:uncharacterized phage-associated protein
MHSARAIANSFLKIAKESNKQLTNMQLQKLVYFAHGWHLALTGEPLLADAVKAWNFGPVIPQLYNSLKTYGNDCITDMIKRKDSLTDEPEIVEETQSEYVKKLVQRVWDVYGHLQGLQMSNLTHAKDTPWDKTWNREKFSVIPDELIKEHFQSLKGK